ncbi:MAG: hypothetical protein IKH78_06195 [Ruminococcus sp.]|nr:hypothetical protein [Ruminococcus sp.]
MKKAERIILGLSAVGTGAYLMYCITEWLSHGFSYSLKGCLVKGYCSVFGVILVISCIAALGVLVSLRIRKRRSMGKPSISGLYTFSFYSSFLPLVLLLIYSLISVKSGFTFLWSTSYGGRAFCEAFVLTGAVFCMIPVFPFCLFWQILYIVKRLRSRKECGARKELSI